jgi:hypothetical protein
VAGHTEQAHVRRVEGTRPVHPEAVDVVELERHVGRAALLAASASLADDRRPEPPPAVPVACRLRRVLLGSPAIPRARSVLGASTTGQRNLAVTANTYTHVLIDETEVEYAGLLLAGLSPDGTR